MSSDEAYDSDATVKSNSSSFEIRQVHAKRIFNDGSVRYLVEWTDYPRKQWIHPSKMNSGVLISDFEQKYQENLISRMVANGSLVLKSSRVARNKSKHSVRSSKRLKRSTTSAKRFICDICSQDFVRKNGVSNHIQRMHLNLSFSCSLCSSKFKCRANLNTHKISF